MTASADHIKAMVKSHGSGDDHAFYAVALQVAAKAARQGHHKFAGEVKKLVEDARESRASVVTPLAQPRGELGDLVVASFPDVSMRDLVVGDELRQQLNEVIAEQRQRHVLMGQRFSPVHRLLLEGSPGTGKTMTAAVLAHELDLPLLTIRLDALLSKYLGETAGKLRVLFDAASSRRSVYLFDEFDALGGDRAGNDVGEARRILSSFLLFLDTAGPESLIVAATNHRGILDRALFRRFDLVLTYDLPSPDEAVAVMKGRLGSLAGQISWSKVQQAAGGLSQAELVKAAEVAAKRSILAGEKRVAGVVLVDSLRDRSESTVG